MSDKLKNLLVRTISGAVLLLVVVGALAWSKWSAGALFALIMVGGLVEFYRLCRKNGVEPMSSVGIATSLAIFALAFAVFMLYCICPAISEDQMWLRYMAFIAFRTSPRSSVGSRQR